MKKSIFALLMALVMILTGAFAALAEEAFNPDTETDKIAYPQLLSYSSPR